jgi:hypothetical protein
MPNLITKGQAVVGKLTAAAELVALKGLTVETSVSLPSQGTVPAPTGGGTVDAESRTAIGSIISILQAVGLAD